MRYYDDLDYNQISKITGATKIPSWSVTMKRGNELKKRLKMNNIELKTLMGISKRALNGQWPVLPPYASEGPSFSD